MTHPEYLSRFKIFHFANVGPSFFNEYSLDPHLEIHFFGIKFPIPCTRPASSPSNLTVPRASGGYEFSIPSFHSERLIKPGYVLLYFSKEDLFIDQVTKMN
jgi:hypothetical protein